MKKIYCISGLGTDEKIFERLTLHARMEYIPWLRPLPEETIAGYSKRMAEAIKDPEPILLGVSFGGMIGIEIARQMPIKKLVIVSAVKSANELPGWMRFAGKWNLYKFLPTRSYKFTEKIDNDRLGVSSQEEKELVSLYRKKTDQVYFKWAVKQVFKWDNKWYPDNIIQIHGKKDRIFPAKNLKPDYLIDEGTHIMIFNRAGEVSRCINDAI